MVVVGFSGDGQSVSTVADTASPATSFSKTVSSATNQDTEIWCGQYTAASGSDKITVTASASATFVFTFYELGGLKSCTADTTEANHGTSAAMSVASFTPTTGDSCVGEGTEHTGATATFTDANPFEDEHGGNAGSYAPLTSSVFGSTNYAVSLLRSTWNSNDGATTATITPSSTSSPTWDEVIACYPTFSSGNGIYQEGVRGGPRTAASPQTAGIDNILQGDYILGFFGGTGGVAATSVATTTTGAMYTFSKAASTDVHNDAEIWITQATSTYSGGALDVSMSFTGTCSSSSPCLVEGMSIEGIGSATPEVFTGAGNSGGAASITSSTPNAGDLCVVMVTAVGSASGLTFSMANNQPFNTYQTTSSGDTYFAEAFAGSWPSGVSTTAALTLSGGGTMSAWDEVVACFPGTVVVPVTCTMANSAVQATLTLSESSGNSLSPSSLLCNGVSHNITVDPSVTLTATEPADGSNTRDRFSGGVTSTNDAVCGGASSGQCSAWSFTNYEQLENTYTAAPRLGGGSTTWDYTGSNDIAVSYTAAGSSSTCFLSTTSGGGAVSCSNLWVDYDTSVSFGTLTVSSTEKWVPSADTASYVITTAGSTLNGDYSRQWQVQFAVSPSSIYGSITPSATAFYNDTSSVSVTGTANPGYSFSTWTASTGSITFASSTSPSTSATIGAAGTITANFVTLSLSRSVSDQFAFSDSVIRTLHLARAPADAFAFLQSVLPVTLASRAAHDVFAFADAVARMAHLGRSASDAFQVSDSASRVVVSHRGAADSFALSDAPSAITGFARAISDAFRISDSVTRSLSLRAVASDVFSFVDSPIATLRFSRATQDAFSFADSVARYSRFARLASDAFHFLDSPSAVSLFSRAAQDAFDFADAVSRISHFSRSSSDAFSFVDSPSAISQLSRGAQDVFSFLEHAKSNVQLGRSPADSFLFGEGATAIGGLILHVGDSFSFADSVHANSIFQRLASDSFAFLDTVRSSSIFSRLASDSFQFLDSAARDAAFGRSPSDSFPIRDGVSRQLSLFRNSADSFRLSDTATAFNGILVLVRDSFLMADSAARQLSARLSVADRFIFSESTGGMRHGGHLLHEFVYVSDGFPFIGQATRVLNLPRALSDSVAFLDSALRTVGLFRGAGDSYVIGGASSRMLSLSRDVGDLARLVGTGLGRLTHLATTPARSVSFLFTLPDLLWLLLILILAAMVIILVGRRRRNEDKFKEWT